MKTFRKFVEEYKPVKESVGQLITITLVRKPTNLDEVKEVIKHGSGERVRAKVEEVKKLSTNEYDKLSQNFFAHTSWLDGKGGTALPENVWSVIEVQAPGRKTLYIDPEGFDYARYVGY